MNRDMLFPAFSTTADSILRKVRMLCGKSSKYRALTYTHTHHHHPQTTVKGGWSPHDREIPLRIEVPRVKGGWSPHDKEIPRRIEVPRNRSRNSKRYFPVMGAPAPFHIVNAFIRGRVVGWVSKTSSVYTDVY
jgi:hypothetical protein